MPIRFDQLLEFVPQFRPPVYTTPHAWVADETSTVVGEIDMSLTQGLSGDGVTEKRDVVGTVGLSQSRAIESAGGGGQGVSESKLAQITKLLVGMTESLVESAIRNQAPGIMHDMTTRLLRQELAHSLGVKGL